MKGEAPLSDTRVRAVSLERDRAKEQASELVSESARARERNERRRTRALMRRASSLELYVVGAAQHAPLWSDILP